MLRHVGTKARSYPARGRPVASIVLYPTFESHFLAQEFFYVGDAVADVVDLLRDTLNFSVGVAIDLEVEFTSHAVFMVLTVLAHHDDRCLEGSQHREKEIQQNERVGVPGLAAHDDVDDGIDDCGREKQNDEGPGAAKCSDSVSDALSGGGLLINDLVGWAHGAATCQLVGVV